MTDGAEPDSAGARFGARLRDLMEAARPQGRRVSYREIEAGVGGVIQHSQLQRLVSGAQGSSPRWDQVEALARFFKVPISHFMDEPTGAEQGPEAELIRRLRLLDSAARDIVLASLEAQLDAYERLPRGDRPRRRNS